MDEPYLCIDIGTSSIKALEKDVDGHVLRWGILERASKPFHASIQPIDVNDAAGAISELLSQMGTQSRVVVMSLPSFYVFTATVDRVDPKLIPANPATYKLEAFQLSDGRYFVMAIPKDVAEKYREIAEACGLRLERLELESSAIARRFHDDPARKLVVDVGGRSTTFSVERSGQVEYIFHSDFGDSSQALNVIMNKTREIAEKRRVEQVLFSNSIFNIANGLQKVSSYSADDNGGPRGIRSSY